MKKLDKTFGVIVAGVGGQGAITVAQLLLGAAWRSEYHCLQSEVHGMSQRGGAVNAHVVFDSVPVTSPIISEGTADLLIGIEPLETLRYISMLRSDAQIISSIAPVKNMDTYPEEEKIFAQLKKLSNVTLIDTEKYAKELSYRHAGNMILLGVASKHLPIEEKIWKQILEERFKSKGQEVIDKNFQAFEFGRNL